MIKRFTVVGLVVLMGLGAGEVVSPVHGEAVLLAQSEADLKREGDRLLDEGVEYEKNNRLQEALRSWESALQIYKKIGDKQGIANTSNNLGLGYSYASKPQKAVKLLQESIKIKQQLGYRKGVGDSLTNLGIAYISMEKYQEAIPFYEESIKIKKVFGDQGGIATASNGLGIAYLNLGQYDLSLIAFRLAFTLAKEVGEKEALVTSANNLGSMYMILGQYLQGFAVLEQSLKTVQDIEDESGESTALNTLGLTYMSLGEYTQALKVLERALKIREEMKDRDGIARVLNNLGVIYHLLNNHSEALKHHQQSLDMVNNGRNKLIESHTLNNFGVVYQSLEKYSKALEYHQKSLDIAQQVGNKEQQAASLSNLGLASLKSGKSEQAKQFLIPAIQIQEILQEGLSDNERIDLFEKRVGTYKKLQKSLITLNQIEEALVIAERGRTRSLIEQLSAKQDIPYKNIAVQDLKKTAREQNSTIVEYTVISDGFHIEGKTQEREAEIYCWVIKPDGTITFRSIDLRHLWDHQIPSDKTLNINLIRLQLFWDIYISPYNTFFIFLFILTLLGSNIALVYFLIDKNPTKRFCKHLILLLALSSFSLIGCFITLGKACRVAADQSEIATTQTLLDELASRGQNLSGSKLGGRFDIFNGEYGQLDKESLQTLHQLLIDPIADLLPTDPKASVIFIPDRDLFFVPFPALLDASEQYLIDKHTLSTAPSIQLLATTQKPKTSNFKGENTLIVGNPIMPKYYDISLDRVASLDPLPHTQREAETIAKLLQSRPILGSAASETAITQQMPRAKLLHFATHGLLDGFRGSVLNNNLGAIALTPDPQYDPQDPTNTFNDGLLTAPEIYNMQLNADLAVLSACQTGLGRVTSDGIVGLSRAFINAGVPTVLISLWNVPDAPTADLMTEFYQNLQNTPNKAQALRQAMLTIKATHPEPKNWAGFTVMGQR